MKNFRLIDYTFLIVIFCPVLPILLFLLGWWGIYLLGREDLVPYAMLCGLFAGFGFDFLLWSRFKNALYDLHYSVLIFIFLFYSLGMFGFFMGVPIFNLLLAIPAGVYFARRNQKGNHIEINKIAAFTTFAMLVICILSAYFALSDKYTALNLEGMLNLGFAIQDWMLYSLIFIGGLVLIVSEFFLTQFSYKVAKRIFASVD